MLALRQDRVLLAWRLFVWYGMEASDWVRVNRQKVGGDGERGGWENSWASWVCLGFVL
jgi:hypothetical protein